MTPNNDPSDAPIPGSNYRESNWLAWLDNPSKQDVEWLAARQEKVRLAGERLRARLSSVPFYAKRAAECKAAEGSEAPYWESLVTGTYN